MSKRILANYIMMKSNITSCMAKMSSSLMSSLFIVFLIIGMAVDLQHVPERRATADIVGVLRNDTVLVFPNSTGITCDFSACEMERLATIDSPEISKGELVTSFPLSWHLHRVLLIFSAIESCALSNESCRCPSNFLPVK
jgi:hypothetical protein